MSKKLEKAEAAVRMSREMNRGTLQSHFAPHFEKPRVWKITHAAYGIHIGELTGGGYAVGKLRAGIEPPRSAYVTKSLQDAEKFFIDSGSK